MKKIITISRQFGSAGRTIGRQLAESLGYAYYDSEIIDQVHEATGFCKEYIEEHGEYAPTKSFFSYAFIGRDINGVAISDYIWNAQRKVIMDIADKDEPCVIVGRCADYILKDRPDVLNVYIHADMDFKIEHILSNYGDTDESPEKRIKDKDKKRAVNYKYYTDREWGVCTNYDVSLNSGRIGIDKCVQIIADLAK